MRRAAAAIIVGLILFTGCAGLTLVGSTSGLVAASTTDTPPAVGCAGDALSQAAAAAGFTGQDLLIAPAVALAESGGNPNASHLNSNGTTDYGLWQINSIHAAILASGDWRDPAANARMAYAVWQTSGWGAWVTYNSGAYRTHMAGCTPPSSDRVAAFLAVALAQQGSPYVWGGTLLSNPPGAGNGALDCSGLVVASWAQVLGHPLPIRTADQLYHASDPVPSGQEQPGDLGFSEFTSLGAGAVHVGHVWIVVRPGLAMEASFPGQDLAQRPYNAASEGALFGRLPASIIGG